MNENIESNNTNDQSNLLDTFINLVDKNEIHSIIDCQKQMFVY